MTHPLHPLPPSHHALGRALVDYERARGSKADGPWSWAPTMAAYLTLKAESYALGMSPHEPRPLLWAARRLLNAYAYGQSPQIHPEIQHHDL